MWLYIPPACSPSATAPESPNSPSDWRFEALARSVVWSGKPRQPGFWWRACKLTWIRHLCGQIFEPSMADAGVARWISSCRVPELF